MIGETEINNMEAEKSELEASIFDSSKNKEITIIEKSITEKEEKSNISITKKSINEGDNSKIENTVIDSEINKSKTENTIKEENINTDIIHNNNSEKNEIIENSKSNNTIIKKLAEKKSQNSLEEITNETTITKKVENNTKIENDPSSITNLLNKPLPEINSIGDKSIIEKEKSIVKKNESKRISKLFKKTKSSASTSSKSSKTSIASSKKSKKELTNENSFGNYSFSTNNDSEKSTMSVRKRILSLIIPRYSSSQLFSTYSNRTIIKEPKEIVKDKKKKKKTTFLSLPDSVVQEIFKLAGPVYSIELKHTCSKFYKIGNDPETIAKWLYYYYDPIVLTISENKQRNEFKRRITITPEIICAIVNKIDASVVELFDNNMKNTLTTFAIKTNNIDFLNNLLRPKCFNVEEKLVSVACQNRNKTSQEFICYLFEMDFILPKSTFFEACHRFNNYVISSYLSYNRLSHKEIDGYFKKSDKKQYHPLVAAARSNDMELLKYLVEEIGCSVSLFGSPAFEKALSHNNLEIAKYIINIYPQLDLNDNDMMTLVSRAAEKGRLDTIKLIKLIYDKRYGRSKTTNVFRKPRILANAVTASAITGQLECCVWLMERDKYYINADYANRILACFTTHLKGKSFLPFSHRSKFLQYLTTQYTVDLKGEIGRELMKICIKENDSESIKVLIDNGIEYRYENEIPLQMACGYGKIEAVKVLLENGAKPNKSVYKALRRGVSSNKSIVKINKESRNIIMKMLNEAQPSKRFSLSFQI